MLALWLAADMRRREGRGGYRKTEHEEVFGSSCHQVLSAPCKWVKSVHPAGGSLLPDAWKQHDPSALQQAGILIRPSSREAGAITRRLTYSTYRGLRKCHMAKEMTDIAEAVITDSPFYGSE